VHFLVADETGSYQEVHLAFDIGLKNSSEGYIEKRLDVKNATVGPLKRLGSVLNAGMATDLTIQAYSQGKVKVVLADDSGKVHLFEDGQSKKSVQVSDLGILSLLSHQFNVYVYISSLASPQKQTATAASSSTRWTRWSTAARSCDRP